jgi:pimeloyl-ACP methyl ester carboxylesterase
VVCIEVRGLRARRNNPYSDGAPKHFLGSQGRIGALIADVSRIVLLPGLDGTGRLFRWLAAEYAGPVPLQVVSYPADARLGYRELTEYIREIIGSRNVVVLGESFSGPIAVEIAATMPNQVKGLILAATFVRSPWPAWLVRIAARLNPGLAPRPLMYAILRGRNTDPSLNMEIEKILTEMAPEVRSKRLNEVADADVGDRLKAVQCPILVLHGTKDWLVPRTSPVKSVKSDPNATIALFEAPHMLLQTHARAAARAIEAFVGKIGTRT